VVDADAEVEEKVSGDDQPVEQIQFHAFTSRSTAFVHSHSSFGVTQPIALIGKVDGLAVTVNGLTVN
ncbi:MAG TPA: hypothetical protein VJZ91_11085, partial [Blastocatellia bacterium]|nr:hypothetical protein [Blastocatellia bacterium]